MSDFSFVVERPDIEQPLVNTAVALPSLQDVLFCAADCEVRLQPSRRKPCFCDYLASVDASLDGCDRAVGEVSLDTVIDQLRWQLERDATGELCITAVVQETTEALAPGMFHPDADVRLSFVRQLAESDLAPFLDDPNSEVRELAYDRLLTVSKRHVSQIMNMGKPRNAGDASRAKETMQ